MWLFIIVIIGFAVYGFYKNNSVNTDNRYKNNKSDSRYQNHCWNCKSKIDSHTQRRCSICGWYICDKCGECGCDYDHRY